MTLHNSFCRLLGGLASTGLASWACAFFGVDRPCLHWDVHAPPCQVVCVQVECALFAFMAIIECSLHWYHYADEIEDSLIAIVKSFSSFTFVMTGTL